LIRLRLLSPVNPKTAADRTTISVILLPDDENHAGRMLCRLESADEAIDKSTDFLTSGDGSAPRRRELPVEEESTQRVVD
jgi:hypothetical protein